jgi:hypothetical protein
MQTSYRRSVLKPRTRIVALAADLLTTGMSDFDFRLDAEKMASVMRNPGAWRRLTDQHGSSIHVEDLARDEAGVLGA